MLIAPITAGIICLALGQPVAGVASFVGIWVVFKLLMNK